MLTMLDQQMYLSAAQHIIIKFLACEGVEVTEIFQRLTVQFADQTLSRTHVFSLHKEFKEGREWLKIQKHDHHP